MRQWLVIGLLLWSVAARAAVEIGAISTGDTDENTVTSWSFPVTIDGASNRAVFIAFCTHAGATYSVATLNGVNLTLINEISSNISNIVKLFWFYMPEATLPTGIYNASFAVDSLRYQAGGAIVLYNVLQATPIEDATEVSNGNDTTTISTTVTTTTGDMALDTACKRSSVQTLTMTAQSNRTERYSAQPNAADPTNNVVLKGSTRTGTGTLTMNWNGNETTGLAVMGVNVNAGAVANPTRSVGFKLLR